MTTRQARQRESQREDTREEIKAFARQQMAAEGTAALSLRAIARDMEMTAPALYRYFPSRDELITALIVDAFNALADALEAADAAQPQQDYTGRLRAVLMAYRGWALEHPTDFQLIYGNPIPGYSAPRELTVPAVVRGFQAIIRPMGEADQAGLITIPPEAQHLPASLDQHFHGLIVSGNYPISSALFYLGVTMWTRIHGIIMLELYHHLGPTVGSVDDLFAHEVQHILRRVGMGL
ncbi:MAG: TetR/AcrR family transcriptional regulator [bacterium]|nr:TetR/AcrR family transcriptional regulator [bacterium]